MRSHRYTFSPRGKLNNYFDQSDPNDPHPLPPKVSGSQLLNQALTQIQSISVNPIFGNNSCAKCQASLEVAKFLALAAPEEGPNLAVELCLKFNFSTKCGATYGRINLGSVITQVVANADVGGYDGQVTLAAYFQVQSDIFS
jgi:sphingomyelin phosphodiesterase